MQETIKNMLNCVNQSFALSHRKSKLDMNAYWLHAHGRFFILDIKREYLDNGKCSL